MSIHHSLEKKFSWYKKWHRYRYANLIHYIIGMGFVVWTTYLALELLYLIKNGPDLYYAML